MQKRVQKKKVNTLDIFWCLVQAAFNQWLLALCSIHTSRRIPGDFYICLVEYKPNDFAYTFIEADLEEGVRGVRPPKIRKANVIQR
jgi:hypothetical protein